MGHEFDDRNLDAADRDNDSYYATHIAYCEELEESADWNYRSYVLRHIGLMTVCLERKEFYSNSRLFELYKFETAQIIATLRGLPQYESELKDLAAIQVHFGKIDAELDYHLESMYALSKSA
jgi:hypothetical protein